MWKNREMNSTVFLMIACIILCTGINVYPPLWCILTISALFPVGVVIDEIIELTGQGEWL